MMRAVWPTSPKPSRLTSPSLALKRRWSQASVKPFRRAASDWSAHLPRRRGWKAARFSPSSSGRVASVMIFADGQDYKVIAPAQDYKRVNDHDEGPNTGGMGAFSMPGLIDEAMMARIRGEVIEPALAGLRAEDYPFKGFLYAGL